MHTYGVWCDEDCQALDSFRVDEWSKADVFLLVIMCVFMAAMMLLVVAKRLKASQKARMYGDESYKPGLPPLAMALIFVLIMGIIVTLAKLKFVNETLVFAVVTCILLFIYMLKLTLFESRRPVLLAAPRHDMFELHGSPLEDQYFN
jgi:UDP-N-acetylmuramyl pentapeptide phosphotransferase/UDP-N-acetylglucosamine-1-phosphate transferase